MDQQRPILRALAADEPDIAERIVSRRAAIRGGAAVSGAVAAGLRLASAPVALAALARNAFGQARLPAAVNSVLNFALVLERLEAQFYNTGLATPGLIPAADRAIFQTIADHENAHVAFLVQTLGAAARPSPAFDFTGGNGSGAGPYANVFTPTPAGYETFKAVAQAFEDTGVRAYKGQAPALLPYDAFLQAALTIHSVEARHAAEVRRLRGNFMDMEPFHQGWINGQATDVPGTAPVYAGEANVVHAGVDVAAVAAPFVADDEVTEAFDEPLTQAQVLAIVDPFIVG